MILGLIDHDRGELNQVSLQMLTLARELAAAEEVVLEVILVGEAARPLAEMLPAYDVSAAHLLQHDELDDYAPAAWAGGVVELIEALQPQAVVAPGTERGNEVLAHVAARTELPMAANCTAVSPDGDRYRVTRLRWGGSLLEEAHLAGDPKLFSVAPHAIQAEITAVPPDLTVHDVPITTLTEKDLRVRVVGREEPEREGVSLSDARIVVGGGRGVGSAEGFAVLEELAELLDGAVGGSRVATNNGWRPHSDQIGQTGTRIAPDLYIACGISGAIQHMVGCKGAKQILVINEDPEAPIFAKADYAIVGDLHEIVPALSEEIRKVKG